MSRRYINQLVEGENVKQVFLLSDKQLRTNRAGNLYIQMRLSDKTGSMNAMMWNANEKLFGAMETGSYVEVIGTAQFYNGNRQVIVTKVNRADMATVDEADFVTLSTGAVDKMAARVAELLREIRNVHLRNLAECFLIDESFMQAFAKAPAGIKNHHAYHGGLLEHVLSLMELVAVVAPRYENLDPDVMQMGAFLHDMGKVRELSFARELSYSDEGQLVGHIVIGVEMLNEKIAEAEKLSGEPFPPALALQLKHLILSHHGTLEHGSPKLPMTLEAIALHYLDNLDAKIHHVTQIISEDADAENEWTAFQPTMSRKIFKGEKK